jgi:hypothetical protein
MPAYECGIEALSEETGKAYGDISLGPSRVFWLRDNGFSQRDKDPSNPTREDRLALLGVTHVAAESDNIVYIATAQDVIHYDVVNDQATEITMNTNPTGLTVHKGFVYWPSSADAKIYKGRPVEVMMLNDQTGAAPSLIASSEGMDQVYWIFLGPDPGIPMGGIKRLSAGDVIVDQNTPSGIAADGEDVYWITREGKIHRYSNQMHVEAGPLVMGMNVSSGRIAVSADHVYWLGPDAASCTSGCDCGSDCGAVWRAPKSDITQNPEKFASMSWSLLKGLAVDATHVYWTTGDPDAKLLRKAH